MRYANIDKPHSSSEFDLACSIVSASAQDKHGKAAGAANDIRRAAAGVLGLGSSGEALARLSRLPATPWTRESDQEVAGTECASDAVIAIMIWAVAENVAPQDFSFDSCLFEQHMRDALELYEECFGRLSGKKYRRVLRKSQYPARTAYTAINSTKRSDYEIACAAYDCLNIQWELAGRFSDLGLMMKLQSMDAASTIRAATAGKVDMSGSWDESVVSYTLAAELMGALSEFYAHELEAAPKEEKQQLGTLDSLSQFADEHDMELKLECFLDGVSVEDILA